LNHRREVNEKYKDENAWSIVPPPGGTPFRHLLLLLLRKASGFHVVVGLSSMDHPYIGLPLIAAAAYYSLWVDRTGSNDFGYIIQCMRESLTTPPPPENETDEQMELREMTMIMKTLDSTFAVGAPLCAGLLHRLRAT
jgi:hypothetical protein